MRLEEYLKSEESAVRHCASRDLCPFGMICGAGSDDALFPYVFDVDPSELIWTDLRREHRVFVIQSGLFSCIANLDHDEERPFALLGCGYTSGVAELYVDRGISQSYYLRALTESRMCSFSAKVLRRQLEGLGSPLSQRILACALLNLSGASYALSKILLQSLLYDRVSMMLVYLHQLKARDGAGTDTLALGHATIADLVGADRVAVTRTLHKMEENSLVKLGYRSITLLPALFEAYPAESVSPLFHIPKLDA